MNASTNSRFLFSLQRATYHKGQHCVLKQTNESGQRNVFCYTYVILVFAKAFIDYIQRPQLNI